MYGIHVYLYYCEIGIQFQVLRQHEPVLSSQITGVVTINLFGIKKLWDYKASKLI